MKVYVRNTQGKRTMQNDESHWPSAGKSGEWKNGEVSLWKINSAVERKGLPPLLLGNSRWIVSWEGGGGGGGVHQSW